MNGSHSTFGGVDVTGGMKGTSSRALLKRKTELLAASIAFFIVGYNVGYFLSILKFYDFDYFTVPTETTIETRKMTPSSETVNSVNTSEQERQHQEELVRFMDEFLELSRLTFPRISSRPSLSAMRQCTPRRHNYTFPSIPTDMFVNATAGGATATYTKERESVSSLDDDDENEIFNRTSPGLRTWRAHRQRYIAEQFWLRQDGIMYMQHSRKAGGTTLCMLMLLNRNGLIKERKSDWSFPSRKTCQLCEFCCDCAVNERTRIEPVRANIGTTLFQDFESYPRLLSCVLQLYQRNFIEMEGTVSPPDILTNPEWSNYVFVSTIRHPISRIISSMRNDDMSFNYPEQFHGVKNGTIRKSKGSCPKRKAAGNRTLSHCAHTAIESDDVVLNRCRDSIYYCYSNYFIRMFSGQTDPDEIISRDTMERAKQNFERYSCVLVQEYWDDTVKCFTERLGLHLNSHEAFNVGGQLQRRQSGQSTAMSTQQGQQSSLSSSSPSEPDQRDSFLQSLNTTELNRLMKLNELDIEFYEWAKERIFLRARNGWE